MPYQVITKDDRSMNEAMPIAVLLVSELANLFFADLNEGENGNEPWSQQQKWDGEIIVLQYQ